MTYRVERTDEEIADLLNSVSEQIDHGGTRFPGMSYENGIDEALRWVVGQSDEHPYNE